MTGQDAVLDNDGNLKGYNRSRQWTWKGTGLAQTYLRNNRLQFLCSYANSTRGYYRNMYVQDVPLWVRDFGLLQSGLVAYNEPSLMIQLRFVVIFEGVHVIGSCSFRGRHCWSIINLPDMTTIGRQ